METNTEKNPENIISTAERLATALLRAKPITAYQQAKARLDADLEALKLIKSLSEAQVDLRMRQLRNAVSQEDVDQLRSLQRQIQSNQRIMDFAQTQQEAMAYLSAVNQEISQSLGVDFASLAGPASC
ncbi:YlbF family regulator [Geobacter sp. SVR]|uniref:YlbF family regulator n=1 Tax=Geobacter sp. SVR TaxID=2495594 RepID=UPI00143F03F6|nr:YlbF family regulator [Geobacter sp. SVR]BCS51882.1 hypothetical protein GSVR_01900 [Geobacter sp. SVR]GCF87734.1 hypothetical protein GSbR_43340 [Geobacter sp. SVR]